jgi:DNA-binding Lrp family transcriptional regulator
LSVKFGLLKGYSRSGPYSLLASNPPSPSSLGVPEELALSLRSIPLTERPYREVARKLGVDEDYVVELINRLLSAGVLGDPGASLEGRLLGFTENALIAAVGKGKVCECLARMPYTTHVVERDVYGPGEWPYNCYAMIHAKTRDVASMIINELVENCDIHSFEVLYSIRDLKPGVLR